MGHHMVVEPAQCGEIFRVVIVGFYPMFDVMRLKAISAPAAVDGAAAVAPSNKSAGRWWDGTSSVGGSDRLPVDQPDELHSTATQDPLQRRRSDSWSELDLRAGFATGAGRGLALDQNGDQRLTAAGGFTIWGGKFEGILGNRHQ